MTEQRHQLETVICHANGELRLKLSERPSWGVQQVFVESGQGLIQVGFFTAKAHNQTLRLDDLVIFAHFRGLGIGRAALKAIVEAARGAGARQMLWEFAIEDTPVRAEQIRFLLAAGFAVTNAGASLALA